MHKYTVITLLRKHLKKLVKDSDCIVISDIVNKEEPVLWSPLLPKTEPKLNYVLNYIIYILQEFQE